jgi:probable phosphoglycerate mutase
MTTLLFIRHGQTDWNVAGRWQGHTDIPLNATGIAQAEAVARRLANWPIDAIYSSDLQRAAVTAEKIAQSLNLQPIFDPQWREWSLGEFEGFTTAELREQYPGVLVDIEDGSFRPKNGETHTTFQNRICSAYNTIVARHTGQTIAVVSHGGAIHTLFSALFGFSRHAISLRGNTGISRIQIGLRGTRLTLLNDTAHLETSLSAQPGQGGVS